MVEFCTNCEGMMLPSKEKNKKILVCHLCGKSKPLDADIIESYTFIKEIEHPKGEEFKNLEKMKQWKKNL
jgi:DNA-directed RNA polymerase subunit M/transcription elongation factor TFIIS